VRRYTFPAAAMLIVAGEVFLPRLRERNSLQLSVAALEGGASADVARLQAELQPLHALLAGAVGERLGL